MITIWDIYSVIAALVPLYMAMFLAYASVKWWKIFSPEQCSGINRFVALFAVPFLSFKFISMNNPYTMNHKFILADTLQKLIVLLSLAVWANTSRHGSIEWAISLFSITTLPNTLVIGVPLLNGMYGDFYGSLMIQVVVLQSIVWYTFLLFLLEYRAAKLLISKQFPDTAASIASIEVDADVVSLDGGTDVVETEAEVVDGDKLHVTVRRSNASRLDEVHEGGYGKMKENVKPPTSVMTKLILIMVWRKLCRNPNTYSSLLGLLWSLISYRYHVKMPIIISKSVSIMSDTGLGMAMFSLGLFMAMQPRLIACGKRIAAYTMAVKFLVGPAIMAATSLAVGIRGTLLRVAIVQAALPLGIAIFVFAKEHGVYPDILSTGVIFGMLVALPVTLIYYIALGT